MGTAPGSGQLLAGLDRPINDSALPTTTELGIDAQPGRHPIAFTDGGAPTSSVRSPASAGSGSNFDYRVRDAHIVTVSYRFTNDLVAERRHASGWIATRFGNRPSRRRVLRPPPRQDADQQLLSDYANWQLDYWRRSRSSRAPSSAG